MNSNYRQVEWSDDVADFARRLIQLAAAEDVGEQCDWTTRCLVPSGAQCQVDIVARRSGVLAGLPVARLVLEALDASATLEPNAKDGDAIAAGQTLATLAGSAADLLTAERIFLNFLGRLSGIASLTQQYVAAVGNVNCQVYDTRKTTPGWRLLEKYAVRCGGGFNHRLGLHRAVMIKDNHVALAQQQGLTLPQAVEKVRQNLESNNATVEAVEVEVDTLEQLRLVLAAGPDIVLLDNMTTGQLSEAVTIRNSVAKNVVLEASGGVSLDTIGKIARSGVDRVSVGALTHSAAALDIGLDWRAK